MPVERTKLPKSTREAIRRKKAHIRHEVGVTTPSTDSTDYNEFREFLRLKVGGERYHKIFAPRDHITRQYYDIRKMFLTEGFNAEEIRKFQESHDSELLTEIKDSFILAAEWFGKRR